MRPLFCVNPKQTMAHGGAEERTHTYRSEVLTTMCRSPQAGSTTKSRIDRLLKKIETNVKGGNGFYKHFMSPPPTPNIEYHLL